MTRPVTDHGTLTAYASQRCRCDLCRYVAYRYEKRRVLDHARGRPRLVPNVGTVRRVQALYWLGWTRQDIADRAGTTIPALKQWMRPGGTITSRSAGKVAAVFEELCMTPGPSQVTAGKARAQGYAPPLAWDETTIDDPDEQPNYGTYEAGLGEDFDEAVRTLTRDGWSAPRIAEQLGVSERSVVRARTRARGAA